MRKLACLTVLLAACSNSGNGGGGGGGGGNDDGGAGGGSDAFIPTDGPGVMMMDDKVIITMATFPVGAGEEVFKCQTFANPFNGADAEIAEFESHMTTGSHHMLMLYQNNATDGALQDCSGLTFGPMAYGAQQPDTVLTYPAGIATLIKGTQGFNIVSHYLNASANPITAEVQIIMHKATPGSVTDHAGVYFLNNISALYPPVGGIPPMTQKTISATYTTQIPMNLLFGVAHMHSRSINLTATYGASNTMLYTTDSWDNAPQTAFTPPVQLPAGSKITWSCTIDNTTMNTLTFGESAGTNEMCIFDGQYYPVPAGMDPTINVMK
jgi:hypothetical protein